MANIIIIIMIFYSKSNYLEKEKKLPLPTLIKSPWKDRIKSNCVEYEK